MKTKTRFSMLVVGLVGTLAIGFLAACWAGEQPSHDESKRDYAFAVNELSSFVAYLQDTKQTNTLRRFGDFSNASLVSHTSAHMGVNLAILQILRDGRTNDAIEVLEGQVDTDAIVLANSYQALPGRLRDEVNLQLLERVRDYRIKHPFKHAYLEVDDGVAKAFKILDGQAK
jgi:hypothetical protein